MDRHKNHLKTGQEVGATSLKYIWGKIQEAQRAFDGFIAPRGGNGSLKVISELTPNMDQKIHLHFYLK